MSTDRTIMMMHPQPSSVTQLINLLTHEQPTPTQLEITILPDRPSRDDKNNTTGNDDDDSDYYFLKHGIHLGIHAPNLPVLARIFRKEYYTLRKSLLVLSTNNYKTVDDNDKLQRLWESTTVLLLVCPDHATAWSDRKRLLLIMNGRISTCSGNINLWKQEIEYLNFLFSQHSKAPNAWSHRKYVSKQMLMIHCQNNNDNHPKIIEEWTRNELQTCTHIAEKYPKNYYAWTHRRFVVDILLQLLTNDQFPTFAHDFISNLLESELNMIKSSWITKHVSDHSAAHYGGEVLRILISFQTGYDNYNNSNVEENRNEQLINKILNDSQMLISKHPSNEVIWIWRRICSQIYIEFLLDIEYVAAEKFVQNEVQLFLYDNNDDKGINTLVQDQYDNRRYNLYRKTYILWILEHLQRPIKHDSHDHSFVYIKPALIDLKSALIHDLVSDDTNGKNVLSFSNMWSLK